MKRNNITQNQRSNFFSLLFALSSLLFVSCEQVEDFSQETDGDAVKINATIGAMQTRVAYEDDGATNFINGDEICVQNILRETKNIATYTFDGTTWTTTTDALVWNGGSAMNQFQAWYPATASFDSFDLPTDQSAGIEAADWMTAETEEMTKPGSGVLDLNFVHKLTKVTVTVSFNSQYPAGNNYVSMFRFFTNEETPVEVTPHESMDGYTAILLPGVYAETAKFIKLKMNDEADYLTVPVNSTLTAGLKAGKHYTFSLKVGKDAISITKVNVEPWTTKEIDGGMAEEVEPQTYEYDAATNTYAVFSGEYLQVAIDEAELTSSAEHPATVKIMRDMEVTGIPNKYGYVEQDLLMDAGEIVLDLNGHTLTGKTGSATINIDNGAKLTIVDSSESKSGKIQNLLNNAIDVRNESTLVVNNGTFEGKCAVFGFSLPTIVINGGTFKATKKAISPQDATLTITGGTFDGGVEALHLLSATIIELIAGGSFTGGDCDISTSGKTGFLSYNEEGTGATFPGGLSIYVYTNCPTLTDLLANGAAYYDSSGNQLTLADAATSCEGDVTVKRIPATE